MVLCKQILEIKSQICDSQIHFDFNLANSANFWSLEIVDGGSETQLHVPEKFYLLAHSYTFCITGGDLVFFPETICKMEVWGYRCSVLDFLIVKSIFSHQKQLSITFREKVMVLTVLLAAILDFNINCMIMDQVFKHEFPQNIKYFLNTKVKFVCPLCTQTWCIIMIIVTLSAILAAVLFFNFEREKQNIVLGMGLILNQHYPNCGKTTAWQILLRNALQTLKRPFLKNGPWLHQIIQPWGYLFCKNCSSLLIELKN